MGTHTATVFDPLANTAERGCHLTARTGPSCLDTPSSIVLARGAGGRINDGRDRDESGVRAYMLAIAAE